MGNFFVMVGAAGSGKTTYAKDLAKKEDAVVISADGIRGELFGDEGDQQNGGLVFEIANSRILENLQKGRNVVFDATNLRRRFRVQLLKKYKPLAEKCVCVHLDTPQEICLERQSLRLRQVPEYVIAHQFEKKQEPMLDEGWDEIRNLMGA